MSREILTQIVAELEVMNSQLELRADRLRLLASLLNEIEEILEEAVFPPAACYLGETIRLREMDDGEAVC